MKILITGAAGFIGKEVTKGLVVAGHEVLATDLVKDDLSPTQNFVVGDLVSADFISQLDFRCDAIVHLGSIPRPVIEPDEKVLYNNVMGTYGHPSTSEFYPSNVKIKFLQFLGYGWRPMYTGSYEVNYYFRTPAFLCQTLDNFTPIDNRKPYTY